LLLIVDPVDWSPVIDPLVTDGPDEPRRAIVAQKPIVVLKAQTQWLLLSPDGQTDGRRRWIDPVGQTLKDSPDGWPNWTTQCGPRRWSPVDEPIDPDSRTDPVTDPDCWPSPLANWLWYWRTDPDPRLAQLWILVSYYYLIVLLLTVDWPCYYYYWPVIVIVMTDVDCWWLLLLLTVVIIVIGWQLVIDC